MFDSSFRPALTAAAQAMWKALESYTQEQRFMFMHFVWGRSQPPPTAPDFDKNFECKKMVCDEVPPDVAMQCFEFKPDVAEPNRVAMPAGPDQSDI